MYSKFLHEFVEHEQKLPTKLKTVGLFKCKKEVKREAVILHTTLVNRTKEICEEAGLKIM